MIRVLIVEDQRMAREDMENYRIIKISAVQWSQNNLCGPATGKLRHISGRYPL